MITTQIAYIQADTIAVSDFCSAIDASFSPRFAEYNKRRLAGTMVLLAVSIDLLTDKFGSAHGKEPYSPEFQKMRDDARLGLMPEIPSKLKTQASLTAETNLKRQMEGLTLDQRRERCESTLASKPSPAEAQEQ